MGYIGLRRLDRSSAADVAGADLVLTLVIVGREGRTESIPRILEAGYGPAGNVVVGRTAGIHFPWQAEIWEIETGRTHGVR